MPLERDALDGTVYLQSLAHIYGRVGQHDAAIDELESLLSRPGRLGVAQLRIDPTWDPLRGHPRFQTLVAGGHE